LYRLLRNGGLCPICALVEAITHIFFYYVFTFNFGSKIEIQLRRDVHHRRCVKHSISVSIKNHVTF